MRYSIDFELYWRKTAGSWYLHLVPSTKVEEMKAAVYRAWRAGRKSVTT